MTTVEDTFEQQLPPTPAGEAARWLMTWTRRRGEGLTLDEVRARWDALPDGFDFDHYRDGFGWVADQLGEPFSLESMTASDPHAVQAVLLSPSGRRWEWGVTVSAEPTYEITDHYFRRALPEGVEIRAAHPEDGPALRDVARRAAVRLTDASITIDPGDDYFAACRLMGDTAVTYVATLHDVPIGIHCGVSFPVRLQGVEATCCLIAHTRLLPQHSGGGIWGRLNDTVFGHFQEIGGWQVPLAYVRPDNAAAQRLGGAEARWPTRPFRAVLNCAAAAGPSIGRPATATDAARIAAIVNRGHEREELFLPYTEERLAARLSRAPELYSWSDVLIGDAAVAGVWRRGDVHTYVPDDGEPTATVRAVVLDYGFDPGGEEELAALLRAWCGRLTENGITHLSIFSSPGSAGSQVLRDLAERVEEYDLMPPGIAEPPSVATDGVYVDPVYF